MICKLSADFVTILKSDSLLIMFCVFECNFGDFVWIGCTKTGKLRGQEILCELVTLQGLCSVAKVYILTVSDARL